MSRSRLDDGREILIEIVILGGFAKVSAIDPVSGTEVSLMGPGNATRASLEAAALNKLDYVLKKNATGEGPPS